MAKKSWKKIAPIKVTEEQLAKARRIVSEHFPWGGMLPGEMDAEDEQAVWILNDDLKKYGYRMGGGINIYFSYANYILAKTVAGGDATKVTPEFLIGVLKFMNASGGRFGGSGPVE